MKSTADPVITHALRQFWGRVVFFVGMLLGFVPFIMLPQVVVTHAAAGASFGLLAGVFHRLTLMPACVVAFWNRKLAFWWLLVDAAFLLVAMTRTFPAVWADDGMVVLRFVMVLGFGLFGLFTEALGWPPLLTRRS